MVEVVDVLEAKCHYCSSKPCLLFGPFEHKSLQQRRIVQCKKVNCEVVSGHQFSKKMIQFCVGEDLAFLTVDFTFHDQCHICQVRRQPHDNEVAQNSSMSFNFHGKSMKKFGTSHYVAADLLVLGATLVVHMGRFGHLFLGKSGLNSTGLCLRENQQWFFDNILPQIYVHGIWGPPWREATPQFGDFIA